MVLQKKVEDLLALAGDIGPYFAVDPTPDPEGVRLSDLYAGTSALTERLTTTATALGTPDRRVAASITFQGLAARLWSPTLAIAAAAGIVLELAPADTTYDGTRLRTSQPTGSRPADIATGLYEAIMERHLVPLADRLPVSGQVLWGNAASALVGSYGVLISARPALADADLLAAVLDHGELRGTGVLDEAGEFRRHSCCLYYRVPGGGLCGDCVLANS